MTAVMEGHTATNGPRIDYARVAPAALRAHLGLETYIRGSGLESSLLHLIKLRASYLNGCAYCVDMHTKDARAEHESEQRLYAVGVWRETPFFTPGSARHWRVRTRSRTWANRTSPTRSTSRYAATSRRRRS